MATIEITPPKFDLHGFYEIRIRQMVHANNTEKEKVAALKAIVSQAYRQGLYDARIATKDNSKWTKN
jgi:hypothetical protein